MASNNYKHFFFSVSVGQEFSSTAEWPRLRVVCSQDIRKTAIIWRCEWGGRACFHVGSLRWLESWCWLLAGNAVPLFRAPWHTMAAGFPLSLQSQIPRGSFNVLYNLVSWVTHCHLCQTLLVTQSNSNFMWKETAQNMNTRMGDSQGPSWRQLPRAVCGFISCGSSKTCSKASYMTEMSPRLVLWPSERLSGSKYLFIKFLFAKLTRVGLSCWWLKTVWAILRKRLRNTFLPDYPGKQPSICLQYRKLGYVKLEYAHYF